MPSSETHLTTAQADLGAGISIIDPLTDPCWDSFVEQHPFGWLTHLSGWKKVLEETFSHIRGTYLTLSDPGSNTIQAALPLYLVDSWLTGRRLVSIPFATLCDPLISEPRDMQRLFGAAVALLERLSVPHLEIRTLSASGMLTGCRAVPTYTCKHHAIKLSSDPDRVRSSFHRTCVKQRIARAENSGLSMEYGTTEAHLQQFYLLHRMTRRRRCLPPQPYRFIKSIITTFGDSGRVQLLMAYKDDAPVAGIIVFRFKDRVSVEFSAVDDSFKQFSPVHFLFWNTIRDSCLNGYRILDFGRTSANNHTLMEFKSHWGTEVSDIPQFFYPAPPLGLSPLEANTLKSKLLRQFCNKAPDFAVRSLGDFCYRHMG